MSSSTPKDKFFERVINPYLAEVLHHPQTIEMHEAVLHIRDVEGPRSTGSVETKLKTMEQQVFKCQGVMPGYLSYSNPPLMMPRHHITIATHCLIQIII